MLVRSNPKSTARKSALAIALSILLAVLVTSMACSSPEVAVGSYDSGSTAIGPDEPVRPTDHGGSGNSTAADNGTSAGLGEEAMQVTAPTVVTVTLVTTPDKHHNFYAIEIAWEVERPTGWTYTVERGTVDGSGTADLATLAILSDAQTEFIDFNLQPNATYRYRIKVEGMAQTAYSESIDLTVGG